MSNSLSPEEERRARWCLSAMGAQGRLVSRMSLTKPYLSFWDVFVDLHALHDLAKKDEGRNRMTLAGGGGGGGGGRASATASASDPNVDGFTVFMRTDAGKLRYATSTDSSGGSDAVQQLCDARRTLGVAVLSARRGQGKTLVLAALSDNFYGASNAADAAPPPSLLTPLPAGLGSHQTTRCDRGGIGFKFPRERTGAAVDANAAHANAAPAVLFEAAAPAAYHCQGGVAEHALAAQRAASSFRLDAVLTMASAAVVVVSSPMTVEEQSFVAFVATRLDTFVDPGAPLFIVHNVRDAALALEPCAAGSTGVALRADQLTVVLHRDVEEAFGAERAEPSALNRNDDERRRCSEKARQEWFNGFDETLACEYKGKRKGTRHFVLLEHDGELDRAWQWNASATRALCAELRACADRHAAAKNGDAGNFSMTRALQALTSLSFNNYFKNWLTVIKDLMVFQVDFSPQGPRSSHYQEPPPPGGDTRFAQMVPLYHFGFLPPAVPLQFRIPLMFADTSLVLNARSASVDGDGDGGGGATRSGAEIKAEIQQLTKILMCEDPKKYTEQQREEANIKLEKAMEEYEKTPEARAEAAKLKEEKRKKNEPLNAAALQEVRRTINAQSVMNDRATNDRVRKNPELKLIVLPPEQILRQHESEYNKYGLTGLSLAEMRAIAAVLPKFRRDQRIQLKWQESLERKIDDAQQKLDNKAAGIGAAPPPMPKKSSNAPKKPRKKLGGGGGAAATGGLFAELLARRKPTAACAEGEGAGGDDDGGGGGFSASAPPPPRVVPPVPLASNAPPPPPMTLATNAPPPPPPPGAAGGGGGGGGGAAAAAKPATRRGKGRITSPATSPRGGDDAPAASLAPPAAASAAPPSPRTLIMSPRSPRKQDAGGAGGGAGGAAAPPPPGSVKLVAPTVLPPREHIQQLAAVKKALSAISHVVAGEKLKDDPKELAVVCRNACAEISALVKLTESSQPRHAKQLGDACIPLVSTSRQIFMERTGRAEPTADTRAGIPHRDQLDKVVLSLTHSAAQALGYTLERI